MKIKNLENLLLRTFVFPADLNSLGTAFGGKILSYLDIAGADLAIRTTKSRISLVATHETKFIHPIYEGDCIEVYGIVEKIGNTSITIKMEIWRNNPAEDLPEKSGEASFVYVSVDENLKPTPIKKPPCK